MSDGHTIDEIRSGSFQKRKFIPNEAVLRRKFTDVFNGLLPIKANERFRELAKEYHPDHGNGNVVAFRALVSAYREQVIRLPLFEGSSVRIGGRWWRVVKSCNARRVLVEGLRADYNEGNVLERKSVYRHEIDEIRFRVQGHRGAGCVVVPCKAFYQLVRRAKAKVCWKGVPNAPRRKGPFSVDGIKVGIGLPSCFSIHDLRKAKPGFSRRAAYEWLERWLMRRWIKEAREHLSGGRKGPLFAMWKRTIHFGL